jgi:hypothetical protein
MSEKVAVFDCGELLDKEVLELILQARADIEYSAAKLPNKQVCSVKGRSFLKESSSKEAVGKIFFVGFKELWKLDEWKLTPLIEREKGKVLLNGAYIEVFYYTSSDYKALQHTNREELDLKNEINILNCSSASNELGLSDIHLLIPCNIENYSNSLDKPAKGISKKYIDSLIAENNSEIVSDFARNFEYEAWGVFEMYSRHSEDIFKQYCFIILAKHKTTKLGCLEIIVPSISVPGHSILSNFCNNKIEVKYDGEIIAINRLLNNLSIDVCGKQRSVVFVSSQITEDAIVGALAAEYKCESEIIGKEFIEKSKENLGQYDYAQVYGSEFCLVEINKYTEVDFRKRLKKQADEMFLFQNITFQEAGISRVSMKLTNEIYNEINNPKRKNALLNYEKLMSELSMARLFLDSDNFVLPAVKISSEKIAKNFRLDRCLDKYNKSKEILEQLINLHKARIDEINNRFLNIMLLIIAIVQVIPIISEMIEQIVSGKADRVFIMSKLSSAFLCFSIVIAFNLVKNRFISNYFKRKI